MTTSARGRFITLEGSEGVGKSSVLPVVAEYLESLGIGVVCTREPGGTPLGEQLRDLLLNNSDPIAAKAELLMMFAARAQLIESLIEPSLKRGLWVLCDRFTDATYAYQGGGRQLGFDQIAVIEGWVQQGLHPDLTLLLDATLETSRGRTQKRRALDRIESESEDFFVRVKRAYLRRATEHSHRIEVIDANPAFELVCSSVRDVIESKIRVWQPALVECHVAIND